MTIQEIANALNIKIGTIDALKMYIGSAVVWEPQVIPEDGLPTGYTELEYISSTSGGNQYIDLGIKLYETLNTNYDIAMKFNIASGNANQAALFACQDSDNDPWPGTFVRVNSSAGSVVGRYIGGTAKDNTIGSVGSDLELPVQTAPNKNVTSLNNSNNTTHQYGTSLFCAFVGGTNTPARYCNAKLYYFKLFVNGTLVRDLIPCKNSSNVVGMYDLVNRVFYTSPNNAAFVAGPEVIADVPSVSYSLLDILYSDSSGNLSVDSQVLPTSEGKTPIALCIAGTNFFGDNEPARWMSLKYMCCNTPDSGTLTASSGDMMWGNNGLDISTIDDITTTYNGGSNDGYLTASWSNTTSNKIPSLYDSNDEWNLSALGTKNTYAVTDVDGKNKTEKILTITTSQATWQTDTTITNSQGQRYSPAACCCWRYNTLGTQQGDWYLPACGEMSMIVVNKTDINTKLAAINTEYSNDCINRLENAHFLTSTEINSGTIFRVLADDGRVGARGKYDNSTVIALMQY